MTKEIEQESFLHESQMEGRANKAAKEITEKMSLEEAMAAVAHIRNEEAIAFFKETKEEDWPTVLMKIYCQDCRKMVPPGMGKTLRGNPRTVCGACGSKKIASGTEKGLKSFYHVTDSE